MNLFDVLRDKDEQRAHEDMRESLVQKVAAKFEPQQDITTYELSLIFKLFAMASIEMDIEDIREKAREYNLIRHFNMSE